MSAAIESLLVGLPELPTNMSNVFSPTDADLLIYLGYMRKTLQSCEANASAREPRNPWVVLGVTAANVEQMQRFLINRASELDAVKRERDLYKLAAETNAATIRAMRDAGDEARP